MTEEPITCNCGDPVEREEGIVSDVIRCPNGECRTEGIVGPLHKLTRHLRERWSV